MPFLIGTVYLSLSYDLVTVTIITFMTVYNSLFHCCSYSKYFRRRTGFIGGAYSKIKPYIIESFRFFFFTHVIDFKIIVILRQVSGIIKIKIPTACHCKDLTVIGIHNYTGAYLASHLALPLLYMLFYHLLYIDIYGRYQAKTVCRRLDHPFKVGIII